ncbi:bifunctional 2-C-methyl-D-erythritol 4-phosphate cytidylyltransferase/2-C-methyl-D-erythritol 2,4-cyclodiphosphate synthase [Pseudohalocynthiibacter sp. F2068]|uniref:bifunctional 2-C-methyl-D-erythritol 4-phosphate cytidylyltransferase/2-C-methyl-D-erythritol 2,4-cyclodiphosphate synthase n=1 Tax=Pseudohalocynthiibacter sp. F2068 TaxID=2926418 RepID=UPI001FF40FD2|nr:bifunctional 2-C-methyl-D-erythritol 4-phosphate cytidylyltransferase/2-C-methyl-D-erythritol 2,4-cyclodiphosphate synthase [Pseudohalocynthiibacter sp. F2068]MCK0100904.1 bifunctional 2-C-methyl-D-erythritol 4-phosphate cytidylyltransferase/2-C-methyl-D-erythritol 2,4-cyclodiphosphate synthase [Pseudohalocynthiibacter sp. F2068]
MSTAAIIVAAGRGSRAGGDIPKQYQLLAGQTVLSRTINAFVASPAISEIILVINPEDMTHLDATVTLPSRPLVRLVNGGETRDASVQAGLEAVSATCDKVLIHDGARPLVSEGIINRVLDALETSDGAAPALAVTDALWRADAERITKTEPRDGLYRAQTPQGFQLSAIRAAHSEHKGGAADDVEVALAYGLDVALVEGDEENLKLTHSDDFKRAEKILGTKMDIRVGNGFDVHRFGPGDHVVLCGVSVPHERGLQGHSDADVGMHAVTDAIYGALAEGDIGQHFPPSDPQWKGAASDIFLRHAVDRAKEHGFEISNTDCTLICEYPKIGPHTVAMRETMARIMGLEVGRISVKATTSERLGFTGRKEGIASMASVTLVRR